MDDFLDAILRKKRDSEAYGLKLDVIVLHVHFQDALMKAVSLSRYVSASFELRDHPRIKERKDIYLHGVKVMWSGGRLPVRDVWYRYSNPRLLKEKKAI